MNDWFGDLIAAVSFLLAMIALTIVFHPSQPHPPVGACQPNQIYVDCLSGWQRGCTHGSHLYACIGGRWLLTHSWDEPPGSGEVAIRTPSGSSR